MFEILQKSFTMFLLVGILIGIPVQIYTQNTLVMGTIQNKNKLVKTVELQVNQRDYNNHVDVYSSNVLSDGSFAFAVEVTEPQYALLYYSRNKALVYLEPNDTLIINADGNSFQYSLTFAGRSGKNNTYLYHYLKENPQELDPFKMLQYRKGTYWYSCAPDMNNLIYGFHQQAFKNKMLLRKEEALSNLDFYISNNPSDLTPAFKEFLTTDIIYNWAYHMMLYGHVFKGKHQVTHDFYDFIDEVPLNTTAIGNYWYREYLLAYFNYKNLLSGNTAKPYDAQYKLAGSLLEDKSLAFVQSEMIYRAFQKNNMEEMLPRYWEFVEQTPYLEFEEKVNSVYHKASRFAEGSPAPYFELLDGNGQKVSLDQYIGKVVYLNFWASWCRPCMSKMHKMQPIMKELENNNVIFLNISLDKNQDSWQNAIDLSNFTGIHVLAPNDINSEIAKRYEVKILPQYYIINKHGSFAQRPKRNTPEAVKTLLLELTK